MYVCIYVCTYVLITVFHDWMFYRDEEVKDPRTESKTVKSIRYVLCRLNDIYIHIYIYIYINT